MSRIALKELQNLNVNVMLQTTATKSEKLPDGRQELMLSGQENLLADMLIVAHGLVPNSSYIPETLLNAKGYVMVDEYLKVKGVEDIWAIGDVCDAEGSQFITCDKQSVYLSKSITSILHNKMPLPYKIATSRMQFPTFGQNSH